MDEKILAEARKTLMDECPMHWDCGRKCGAACCQPDSDGQGGMYLFPGEEQMVFQEGARILRARMGVLETEIFVCDGTCDRGRRPLGCMIFPLTPVVSETGEVEVRFDCRARRMCPLLRNGVWGLRQEFIDAVRAALRLIASDEEGIRFLRNWQMQEEQFDFKL